MRRFVISSILLTMLFSLTAFQCSSTDLVSAKLYLKQGQTAKAKEALLKEITNNPKSDEGYYMLGYLYGEMKDIDSMLINFDKSLQISKKFVSDINNQKLYHWGKNFNGGVIYFNKANSAATEDSSKYFMDISIKSFKDGIKCQPDSAATYQNLVYAYLNAGQPDETIEPLKKLIELENLPGSYAMLGEVYLTKGSTEKDSIKAYNYNNEALTILEKGRKNHPTDKDILLLLSNAYIATNKVDVAMDTFRQGVETDPENKYYRYNYGVLLLNDKQYAEAEAQFKKAIEIDPEYINAIYNMGVTYFRWGVQIRTEAEKKEIESDEYKDKLKLALPYLETYLNISPEEPQLWDLMGRIYANLGMNEQSKKAFEKADSLR